METEKVLDTYELFQRSFKFNVGQQLRHKGDTKGYSADMGLLVVRRVLIEQLSDNNEVQYSREYHCRMVKFSGSGEMAAFREIELMTVEEYTIQSVQDEQERNRLRNESKQTEKEILDVFGITHDSRVYVKNESGNFDKSTPYRYCGFKFEEGNPFLHLREVLHSLDKRAKKREVYVTKKDEFEVAVNP